MMKYILVFLSSINLFSQDWQTFYEKSEYLATPSHAQTIDFCKKLAEGSQWIHYTTFGKSPQQRDLPLLIIDTKANFTPEKVRKTDNVVFMIQAGIHSGEIDGKDAGFMLIRDLLLKGMDKQLLDHVTILFIPIFNVDGHERSGPYNRINQNGPVEMGWRTTAQNYNLNRDYLKADSPEMHAWLELYNDWLPDFFADCHVTDGADYQYTITYFIDQHQNQNKLLLNWIRKDLLDTLLPGMQQAGYPMIDYVEFRTWHDPRSGLKGAIGKPRFADGYVSVQNRPGLLIETHMLKSYKERVSATYQILKQMLSILNKEYLDLKKILNEIDTFTQSKEFREQTFPLTFKNTNDSSMVDFLGYKYSKEKSDLTGGDWFRYSKDSVTFSIPFFNTYEVEKSTRLPEAYIIPVEWLDIVNKLKRHGIEYSIMQKPKKLKVASYKFSNEKWAEIPFENHHTLTFDMQDVEEERIYPAGSYVVPMNQRRAKVIAHILEPEAPDSYVLWGYFDPVFERKEYAESYVMEEYARYMLASDPSIKAEFERKKAEDSAFANNPLLILDWFYQKSPYWDKKQSIYPVGKIFDLKTLNVLLNN